MRSHILPIQTHTIRQLLAPLGIVNQHQGLHVTATTDEEAELPMLYPFRSDHYCFLMVTKGELVIRVNLWEYTLTKGAVLMLSPNSVRQYIKVSPVCCTTSIVFTSAYLSETSIHMKNIDAFEFFSSQVNPLLKLREDELALLLDMLNLLERKIKAGNGRSFQEDVLINFFTGFIYEMSSLYSREQSMIDVRGTRKEELSFRFLKLLAQHFKEERSVTAYALLLNITPKYLSQTVKEITGKTAGDFIDEMVIMEAKIMLNNPAVSIAQVSAFLHFSDQFFFSKYFKKQTGVSPSQYRKTS